MATAILIDGSFFLKRHRQLRGNVEPSAVAQDLYRMCEEHLKQGEERRTLYRILFYDCPPLSKKVHNPISKRCITYADTPEARWRLNFHEELRKMRKVALRLGYLHERGGYWQIRPGKVKKILAGTLAAADLQEDDVYYDLVQKGVDMRIGLDIASIAFKRQADQIILVAGDSDFVPAAKLARREGIDFLLDPMGSPIRPDLLEHTDGLQSVLYKRLNEHGTTPADTTTPLPDG